MERGPTLPGVETDDEDRIVLHVDLDCFYAACERLREPELEGEPLVVGMGYEPGTPDGAVATASYEAREHGVESAQAISTALERLPRAAEGPVDGASSDDATAASDAAVDAERDDADGDVERDDADGDGPVGYYRPVDMAYYESVAEEVKAILHDSAETVREVSIDEAYLDVTERTDWEVAEGYARHVKQRIEREVGLVASVGAAPTMHAAKVASDHDKPDGLVVVEPGDVESFLAPLPVDDLHGIGPVTAQTLREHDVETVADLAAADREWVSERWGDRGLELQDRARGYDPRIVEPRGRPKSLSRESAFAEPEADSEQVRERIQALASAVADRARSKDAMYRTIGIKVVLPPYDVNTRERSLSGPVDDPELVERVALDLQAEFDDERPRKVGVRVSNLEFEAADQSTLGGWDDGGDERGGDRQASDEVGDAVSTTAPDDAGEQRADATTAGSATPTAEPASADSDSVDPASAAPDSTGPAPAASDSSSGSAVDDRNSGEDAQTPGSGHVLDLDAGPAIDESATGSTSGAPAAGRDAGDQTSSAASGERASEEQVPEEPASGQVLDLDAESLSGRSTSAAATGVDSTAPPSESSPEESTSPAADDGLGTGQVSLGSIADELDGAEGSAGSDRATAADDSDGGPVEDRGPSERSRQILQRPDDLPPGQTTLLEFW